MRSALILRLLLAQVVALTTIAVAPDAAAAACWPDRVNNGASYFAGTGRTPSAFPRGVRSNIEVYEPYTFRSSEVTAWTMLHRGGTKWSQVGWWQNDDGFLNETRWNFIQWTDANGNYFTRFYSPSTIGSSPKYQVMYDTMRVEWSWSVNGVILHAAPAHWRPETVQIQGETHTRADQMPGGYNARVTMKESHFIVDGGSTWLFINTAAGVTDSTIHGANKVNAEWYEIWDRACSA